MENTKQMSNHSPFHMSRLWRAGVQSFTAAQHTYIYISYTHKKTYNTHLCNVAYMYLYLFKFAVLPQASRCYRGNRGLTAGIAVLPREARSYRGSRGFLYICISIYTLQRILLSHAAVRRPEASQRLPGVGLGSAARCLASAWSSWLAACGRSTPSLRG